MVTIKEQVPIYLIEVPFAFTVEIINQLHNALSYVEEQQGPKALVITGQNARIFSGGLDLKWVRENGPNCVPFLYSQMMKLLGRLLAYGVPTICAINGKCIGAGLLLAMACDYRVQNIDCSKILLTEILLGLPLPEGGTSLLKAKLSKKVVQELVLSGKAMKGEEALSKGIVDYLCEPDQVMGKAFQIANQVARFGESTEVYQLLKMSLYKKSIEINLKAEVKLAESVAIEANFRM